MEVPILVLCTVMTIPLICGLNENKYQDMDMAIDESSPTGNNILVHNTFHLTPVDQMRTTELSEDTQYLEPEMVRTPSNDRYDFHSDGVSMLEGKIDWLMKSNKQILNVVKELEHKINKTLDAEKDYVLDERRSIEPRSTIDFMDNLEVMNLLNNIHQYIVGSNGRAKHSEVLSADQIQVIKKFVSAIESEKRTPLEGVSNQVLANSRSTIQRLDQVYGMVQDIDERTVRMFDKSCRLGQTFSNENRNSDCTCDKVGKVSRSRYDDVDEKSDRYERTYRNLKRNTNRVNFEPNKYNCHELQKRVNGVYKFASQDEISNKAGRFFHERYCDFDTDGGAWTVIQRRLINDRPENFNRTWFDYKLGFGELDKEFWFGNDFIHQLTYDEDVELRIVFEDTTGRKGWASYSLFRVDSEEYNYNLFIGSYRGTIPNGPIYHNDQEFSTYDRQNDNSDISCASSYGYGWWFNNCTNTNRDYKEITWENWLGSNSLKSSKMMVRPKGLWDSGDDHEDGYIYTRSH